MNKVRLLIVGVVATVATACGAGSVDSGTVASNTTAAPATNAAQTTTSAPPTTATPITTAAPSLPEAPTTSTTAAPTTTTTSPYVVESRDKANGAETSQRATATNQLPVAVFDPVTPSFTGTISTIEWSGIYTFCDVEDAEPLPHATAFDIKIYPDNGDGEPVPGARLALTTVAIEDTGQTATGAIDQLPCQGFTNDSVWVGYDYLVELEEEITLEADVTVWISIQAVTPSFDTFWGWVSSTSGPPSWQLAKGHMNIVGTQKKRVLSIALDAT